MATLAIGKVISALPATLAANTVYVVRVGQGFDLYITDNTGQIAYKANGYSGTVVNLLTQAEYDALTPDPDQVYIIKP